MNFFAIWKYGTLSKKKNLYWEIQLFSKVRNYSDGIDFFNLKINLDRFKGFHSPGFQLEIDFLNIHNHFWIYTSKKEQYNED